MHKLCCFVLLFLFALKDSTSAEQAVSPDPHFAFLMENDMWGQPVPSDRNYTMGVSLSWLTKASGESQNPWINTLEGINRFLGRLPGVEGRPVESQDPVGWVLASSNFTPRDITTAAPLPRDRPYASLLYGGPAYWSHQEDGTILETELYAGVLGTSIGRSVQTWIHRRCCPDRLPQGWDNQIGNSGAPTFLYHIRKIAPISVSNDSWGVNVSMGGEVGYIDRLMAGASLVYGAEPADKRNVTLMTFGNPTPMILGASPPKITKGKGFAAWLDLEVSAILHNQLLQGAWGGDNRVSIPFSEIQPLVAKINAGVELTFIFRAVGLGTESGRRLYWTQSWRMRDLRHNDETNHYWGGFVFTCPL